MGAAMQSGMFAVAFTAIGGAKGLGDPTRVALHALVGCVQGQASSGSCGPSAMAAGFGKWTSIHLDPGNPTLGQFAGTIIAGGTASVLGGGKFANGALQGGIGYIFNHLNTFNSQGNDASLRNAASVFFRANEAEGRYDVFGHGNGDNGLYRLNPSTGRLEPYPVAELSEAIRTDARWRPGMEVKLWACNVGNAATYVQQLANALGSPVTAATSYVWFPINGDTPFPASRSIDYLPASIRNRFIGSTFDRPAFDGKWQTTQSVRK
jgi:hypothetical protein